MKTSDSLQDIGMQFADTITRIKQCQPMWVDLHKKSVVLHDRLKMTCSSYSDYLDCFQRVIDVSQQQDGGAKDLAPTLTKMYVKQRNMETKIQNLCKLFNDGYNMPMKDKLKEWKETLDYLDSKHYKESKRRVEEVKKSVSETERLKKKVVKKGKTKKQGQLCDAERSKETLLYSLQQFEQHALRGALIQERSHFCNFVNMMSLAWETECELMDEGTHLRDVLSLAIQSASLPTQLPADAESSIHKIRLISADTAFEGQDTQGVQINGVVSPRSSFISTNSSSTSGVSSGGSFGTLPNTPKETESSKYNNNNKFSSFDNLARSYPGSDQISSGYGSSPSVVCPRAESVVSPGTRGVVADITRFVEQSQAADSAPRLNGDLGHRKRGSGEYSSLSPVPTPRHNSVHTIPSQHLPSTQHVVQYGASSLPVTSSQYLTSSDVSVADSMETYENLGEMIEQDKGPAEPMKKPNPYFGIPAPPPPDPEEDPSHEPLYENIHEQESLYDVPPPPVRATPTPPTPRAGPTTPTPPEHPSLPPTRSSSLSCRRGSDLKGNTVTAYLERRRSVMSQNRGSTTDLRGSQEIHSSRHSSMSNGSHYGTPRPTSVCSNHSNTDNNYNGNYHNSNGAVNYPAQQFAQPKSNGYASRSDIQGTNGTQRIHGYAVQDNRIAADPNAPHYAVQQHRSSSRLSLKSQPPHYATMTARPNKRTYSLTSLNYGSSNSLHRSNTSLERNAAPPQSLSAVDPTMPPPPPPPPKVGQEISNLCNQITRGGTLRPSQLRVGGMKPGDTSTIKRKDVKKGEIMSYSNEMQHLNLNK
ncbi:protein MTSS 2-like isoform X2 [Bolinopsis microptera]|uniref:protein MTSS 2-like isoform X2 n=1 Tax=Bolinopsis microptera TaxID=2820187 RepID=UPI003079A867